MKTNKNSVLRITGIGLMTAIVIVLQMLGSFIRFGPFSISLVLIPIVIGTALFGVRSGTWLGFVFGLAVLLSGDAAAFLTINVPGTIITVLLKGMAAGLVSGLVYKALESKNTLIASIVAAVVCPIANTGVFLLGCLVFFMDTIKEWAAGAGMGDNVALYMIVGLVGLNFVAEFVINVALSPTIVQIVKIGKKQFLKGKQA